MNPLQRIVHVAFVLVLVSTTAQAAENVYTRYYCWLEGSQVVPPTGYGQAGGGCFFLNGDDVLSYQLSSWDDFVFVTQVHIHGPAPEGMDAPVVFTIFDGFDPNGDFFGTVGPLDLQQLHDLGCGLWYVDYHTVANPLGAVRGQIKALLNAPNPCTLPTGETTWGVVKSLYR
jgi:hypothetical protein